MGKSFWHAPAIDMQPISSIGSGDAFTAGLSGGDFARGNGAGGMQTGHGVCRGERADAGIGDFAD